jgi:SAM-dependent methyltransferase
MVLMNQKILRTLGIIFLLDGLLTLVFGRRFVRLFRFGSRSSSYRRAIDWLLSWDAWQLRGVGAAQAALGAALLDRAPLDVRALYRLIAAFYELIDPGWRRGWYPRAHAAFDRAISTRLPPGGRVLDLGCGLGANLSRLLDLGLPYGSYTGVDLSNAMLERAARRYAQASNTRFLALDLMADPFPAGPFDLITSTWTFEHLPDPVYMARKAWERLEPGGSMIALFLVKGGSFPSRLTARIYPFFSARLLAEDEIRAMPGVVSDRRFFGPMGELALVTMEKPA